MPHDLPETLNEEHENNRDYIGIKQIKHNNAVYIVNSRERKSERRTINHNISVKKKVISK